MRRKGLILILAAAPLAAQQAASAPKPLRLGIGEAIDMALAPEGNAQVQLSQEAVRRTQARSQDVRAALLPNVSSYISESNQTRSLEAFGLRLQAPIFGLNFPERVGPFGVFDARATASQSIFDFSAIRRYQSSRWLVGASEADLASARNQVSAQVALLYMNALAAAAHVEAAEANVALAQALARLAENRRMAGTGTALESTRAQVQLANEQQRLLLAREQLQTSKLQLMRGIGLPLGTTIELTQRLEYQAVPALETKKAIETALAGRPEWKAQARREEAARLAYSGAKYARVPSLGAFGDYGAIGPRLTNSGPTHVVGVMLRVPVFDGGRLEAARAESLSQLRAETIRTSDLRDQIELEVRLALDSLTSTSAQVKVAEEGLGLALREVEQARRRYEAGFATGLEVTDAQTRLERARDNRVSALFAYNAARVDLARAMGDIRQVIP